MDLKIKDKVYIVTGGSKGIGRAIVELLAEESAIPVIVNRKGKEGKELLSTLNNNGKEALYIEGELSEVSFCKSLVEEVMQAYGRIDGLVNNAGKNDGVGLVGGTPDQFVESFHNNLFHYYNLAHYAIHAIIKQKGSIVNISSKTAITGQGGTSAYAAAKGAQLALTREWAAELADKGVRVNAVIPAEVWTPLYENWVNTFPNPQEKLNTINQSIPFGNRMTTSEEIAETVVFLLSQRASHITGQHLFVDGGYTHLDRVLGTLKK